jgi:hypothetical protein
MPASTFSIGSDCQVVVMGPTGRIDLTHVTGFESRQQTTSVRVDRLDGVLLGAELPKGWEGSFEIERGTSAADDMIAAIEQAYFMTGQLGVGTLYQYVTEANGSVSTYQYANVVFRLVNAGQWKGDASVKQKLEFYAGQRIRV